MPLNLPAILALMTTRGLDERKLAKIAGTTIPHIRQILRGRNMEGKVLRDIRLRTVERLAAALGVGVEEILRK
jgi:transcriptional regulator with XRE-family HTH domain